MDPRYMSGHVPMLPSSYRRIGRILLIFIIGLLFLCVLNGILWQQSTQAAQLQQQHISQVGQEKEDWRTGCPTAGAGPRGVVVTVVNGGRFGNAVWEYLSVWSVARRYGVWAAVPRPVLDTLRPVFPELTLPALEDLAARCHLPHLLVQYNLLKDKGNQDSLRTEIEAQGKNVSLVVWQKYSVDRHVFLPYWRELRDQTSFSRDLYEKAQVALRDARDKVRRRAELEGSTWPPDEVPEYVGVHVRRTDFSAYLQRKFPGSEPADERFFLGAMAAMREQLLGRRLVMVVVSDDMTWCRKKLHGPDVVLTGNGDVSRPAQDLAILSACNHSVFAYGTFALTAAMHHPDGIAIVYDPQPRNGEQHVVQAMAKELPRWSVMKNEKIVTGH